MPKQNLPGNRKVTSPADQGHTPHAGGGSRYFGPLPVTKEGYEYIVVIGDYYSKWTEAFPLVRHTAQSVAEVYSDPVFSLGMGLANNCIVIRGQSLHLRCLQKCAPCLG